MDDFFSVARRFTSTGTSTESVPEPLPGGEGLWHFTPVSIFGLSGGTVESVPGEWRFKVVEVHQ